MDKIQLLSQYEKLKAENKNLKDENQKLKEHNDKLIHCIEIYQKFIGGETYGKSV